MRVYGDTSVHEITQLLRAWSAGDQDALDKLTPLVYRELHRAAKRYMGRQQPDHTLQTTALVNEVYLRLVAFKEVSWADRAHFFAVCAQLMRRILTDWARSQQYQKRGKSAKHVPFDEALIVTPERGPRLISHPLPGLDLGSESIERMRRVGGQYGYRDDLGPASFLNDRWRNGKRHERLLSWTAPEVPFRG